MGVARVQARGQITVPQDIREACHIQPGAELYFVQTAHDRFECRVIPSRRSLKEVRKRFTVEGVAPDLEELRGSMGDVIANEHLNDGASPNRADDV